MSLTDKQRTALEESIEHWRRLLACKSVGEFVAEGWGANECACCREFRQRTEDGDATCNGCPISQHTGRIVCEDTPYYDAARAVDNFYYGDIGLPEARGAIRAELQFLESLRDET